MRECSAVSSDLSTIDGARMRMLADVRGGLCRPGQKELPPTYFYDERGSALFDEITRLPEYYPTRAEYSLLERVAPDIVRLTMPRAVAELGAGTATKSRLLLRALVQHLEKLTPAQIMELNIPTGTPLVYELDEKLGVLGKKYLGDPKEIAMAQAAVAAQGKKTVISKP